MSSKNDTTARSSTGNSTDSRGSLVRSDDPDDAGDRLGRRTFVKGLGAAAAGSAALAYDDGPVGDAEAIAPLLAAGAIGLAAGAVGGIAFGASFGGPNSSEVADSLSWQSHVNEFTRAREDTLLVDQTTASLARDVQLVENKAREQAIFAIFEQGVDSGTEADALAAAEDAILDAYLTVEKGIIDSYHIRTTRLLSVLQMLGNSYPASDGEIIMEEEDGTTHTATEDPAGTNGYQDDSWTEYTLLDGQTYDVHDPAYSSGAYPTPSLISHIENGSNLVGLKIKEPDTANYGSVDSSDALDVSYTSAWLHRPWVWADLLSDLDTAYNTMLDEAQAMVDSYFGPAQNGEIDLFEAVGPKYLTDTASTAEDYAEASLALRAMGYPMSKQVVTIEVPTDDGEGLELTGRLSWTAHQGNALTVGQTLSPSNIPGSIFAAVNLPDGVDSLSGNTTDTNTTNTTNTTDTDSTTTGPGAEIVELTGGFEILSAEGASEVTFNDRTLATSDLTNEQVNQVFKENYTANKEATETVHGVATGGGGGWSGLSSTGKGLIVAAAGVAGLGILNGSNN